MKLYIDTREGEAVAWKFKSLAMDNPEVELRFVPLPVGDAANEVMIIEFKSIDDFISSFTQQKHRKDGTVYERMDSQKGRMIDDNRPVKILLIHGDLEDAYSRIHPNSVRGMVASILAQGISIFWVGDNFDWPDLVMRLHLKTMKYVGVPGQTTLKGVSNYG